MRDRFRRRLLTVVSAAAGLTMLGAGAAGASTPGGLAAASGGWKIQSTWAAPKGATQDVVLQFVSCSAADACRAIGRDGSAKFLSAIWNGTTWTSRIVSLHVIGSLQGLSCSAAAACTAVGSEATVTSPVNLVERWNGTRWQQQTAPTPSGGTSSEFMGVSCPGAQSCVAVGSYYTSASVPNAAMAESWDGTSWSVQPMPSTGSTTSTLNGVSCPTATDCVAVGFSSNAAPQSVTLAERWNGTSWTIEKTPAMPASDEASLDAVSCPAANACTAFGSYAKNGQQVTLVEHWNGTRWAIGPALPTGLSLTGLTCLSATSCTGVGAKQKCSDCADVAVAAYWNGTAWTTDRLAVPAAADGGIIYANGVSCPTTSRCEAVGDFSVLVKGHVRAETVMEGGP